MNVVLVSLIENSECQQICLSFGGGHHTLLTLLLLLLIILRKNWQTWNIYRECGIQLKSMKYCEMQSVVSFCACWYDVQAFICSLGSGCNIEFPFEKWIKFDSHKIVEPTCRTPTWVRGVDPPGDWCIYQPIVSITSSCCCFMIFFGWLEKI